MNAVSIKKTPARSAIVNFLEESENPVDASQIIKYLRNRGLKTNKVTVYRIIEFLLKNDLVSRLEFGEGKYRYELQSNDHHHLICQNCGSITEVEDRHMQQFEKEIKNKTGFLVKSHSLEFFGLCRNCQK